MDASAKKYLKAHPGCSHDELENHLIFERMEVKAAHTGFPALSSEEFTQIERLAAVLIY
jgi:hypothetical protein